MANETIPRYEFVRLEGLPALDCPCGKTRRAFADDGEKIVSMHLVEIEGDAKLHYHRRLTEVYYVLEGHGEMELDGQRHSIQPGDAVLVKPGCRHRALGELKILNVVVPAFDPADEWFD